MSGIQSLFSNVGAYFKNFSVSGNYLQAGAVVLLVFLLVLAFAKLRHALITGSMKGGLLGIVFGVALTLILEGFLLVNGNTALTQILGWKNAPKPFSTALDLGKEKLTNVLGVSTTNPTSKDAVNVLQSLDPSEMGKIRAIICTP